MPKAGAVEVRASDLARIHPSDGYMRLSQIVDPTGIDILTIIMLRAKTISVRGPIRGRVVMP